MKDPKKIMERASAEFSVTAKPINFDKIDLYEMIDAALKWEDKAEKVVGIGTAKWKRRYGDELKTLLEEVAEVELDQEHVNILVRAVRDTPDEVKK